MNPETITTLAIAAAFTLYFRHDIRTHWLQYRLHALNGSPVTLQDGKKILCVGKPLVYDRRLNAYYAQSYKVTPERIAAITQHGHFPCIHLIKEWRNA